MLGLKHLQLGTRVWDILDYILYNYIDCILDYRIGDSQRGVKQYCFCSCLEAYNLC